MFTYIESTNYRGARQITAYSCGVEIAVISLNDYRGENSSSATITLDGERDGYLGRASTLTGAKKLVYDWCKINAPDIESNSSRSAVKSLPAFFDTGFYPTPSKLAGRMLGLVDWRSVFAVLEPSAGKGDLADAVKSFVEKARYRDVSIDKRHCFIDCIEIDPDLALILKGKGYRVIADDFLTFQTHKQYDLVLMNPPFSDGDRHLLKALDLMESGGQIVCLLNAETIRNPYTNRRKLLAQKLAQYGAKIEFIENAFSHAQRKTDVEIAMIYVNIPLRKPKSDIFENLKRAHGRQRKECTESTALSSGDWMQNLIDGYDFEADLGEKLISEYRALAPYLSNGSSTYEKPLLELSCSEKAEGNDAEFVNIYLHALRGKYWRMLLERPELTQKMTSAMREEYSEKVRSLSDYEFTRYNIKSVMREIAHQLSRGVEESILDLFERFSAKHSWYPECANNIHYYSGWATNKAHKVGMKVIIPANGCCADNWRDEKLDSYRVHALISDLERAMNYLDRGETEFHTDISGAIRVANGRDINKAQFTYFDCTFYKKGTCHIKFHPEAARIIDRLNIFAGQRKNWLPPSYGKKHYADMTQEEKIVIDEFQGEKAYESVMRDPTMLISTSDIALAALPQAL